jgi:hypothetical protein
MDYPVTFEVDFPDRLSRLSTFFRFFLAIPLGLWVSIWAIFAEIAVVIAWFAIVITGRYPAGLYRFVSQWVAAETILLAYVGCLTDRFPPFIPDPDSDYPVRMRFAGPLPRYSRLKTFLRVILAIPIAILRYVLQLLFEIGTVAAWFTVLILGRMPRGLFDMLVLVNSYTARSDAYLLLLTETYPPFQDDETRAAGVGPQGASIR